ncbi:DUF4245 family protein [Mobilicoccus pelagius]|uniref:DUF4245 domain-containing protein n=1 Tax=Mobilicoccus pelagius NBRC 104925 TaxID=1089455 RepID=H5URA5_9MICO|nr:DUF4245 family protein [Mobilicoccus pelagius]GAB48263.1 hypothetical protein MOPEL_069_00180 [Mobilicoccus pelagius NBRC 104925]
MTSAAPSSPTPAGPPNDGSGPAGHGATTGHGATAAGQAPAARPRGRGNWRSLLLSTAAVGALLFVIFAIVPRPDSVTQPPVDVTPVARQLAEESGTTVWIPQLGEPGKPWKATSVRRGSEPTSWYAGYTRTDDDKAFVAVQQIPADTPAAAAQTWREDALSNGREDGTSTVGGETWTRFTTGGDPARRGLLGKKDDMTTVVSGLADYATLESVAGSLQPYRR